LLLGLLLTSAIALLALGATGFWGVRHVGRAELREVNVTTPLLRAATQIRNDLYVEGVESRDFLSTGDAATLTRRAEAIRRVEEGLSTVLQLDGTPSDRALALGLREGFRRLQAEQGTMIALRRRQALSNGALSRNPMAGLLRSGLIPEADRLVYRVLVSLDRDHRRIGHDETVLRGSIAALLLVCLPLLALLSVVVQRRLLAPLGDLEAAARAIARGDLTVRVPLRRSDEFGRVAGAFTTMTEQIALRTAALEKANQELKDADRYKDEFLAVISHELLTPLNFIIGFRDLLADEAAGPLPTKAHEYLARIEEGTLRMHDLVRKLITMSRVTAGRFTVRPTPTPLDQVIEGAIAVEALQLERHHIVVRRDLRAEGPVAIDAERIGEVMGHLLDNAIRVTPPGGVIEVRDCVQDGRVRVEVVDRGPGIPSEQVPRLFQRFGQLDMSNTRPSGGTGLGLALARAIVEAHGGQIGVETELGAGSTFWFTLPR
jgi:signal transduction histidine kinase